MSSDNEFNFDGGKRRARSASPTRRVQEPASAPSASLIAGAVLAGVGLAGAIAARFLLKKKEAPKPTRRSASSRTTSQRRTIVRRARSNASNASSAQTSPSVSSATTPVKAARPSGGPFLPARKPAAQSPPHSAASSKSVPASSSDAATAAVGAVGAAAAAAAGAATVAAVASSTTKAPPTPAVEEPTTTPDVAVEEQVPVVPEELAIAREHVAEAAHRVEEAVADGDADAVAEAAEQLDDSVFALTIEEKQEALEAFAEVYDAALEARDAVEDADEILAAAEAAVHEPVVALDGDVAAVAEEKEEEKPAAAAEEPSEPAPEKSAPAVEAQKQSAAPALPARNKNSKGKAPAKKPAAAATAADKSAAAGDNKPVAKKAEDTTAAASNGIESVVDKIAQAADAAADAPALPTPLPDEADDEVEDIVSSYTVPALNFETAPKDGDDLTELEEKVRGMSIHAHLLIKEKNKLIQATKEQQQALDMVLAPEAAGKVRPSLVAACAFALTDMVLAQRRTKDAKEALAIAYAAAELGESKGAMIRALTNYAYIVRNENKARSARNAYESAMKIATDEFGPVHPSVEQVKYEYTAYLAKVGRHEDAIKLLTESAETLLAEGDKLEKESEGKESTANDDKKAETTASTAEAAEEIDPGTGLEHVIAEEQAAAEAAAEPPMPPHSQARHFAMRTLLNAAGLLDATGKREDASAALQQSIDIAVKTHGEKSVPHMNAVYTLGVHLKRHGDIQEAIAAHESVLSMMDETIEVYEPELLQNRVAILRDTAVLYDTAGEPETALDYAYGALVNAKTLAGIMTAQAAAPRGTAAAMLEPFWLLVADLKAKTGDTEGAAEARREALKGKLTQGIASRGGRAAGSSQRGSSTLKRAAAGTATRAGGRRV